MPEGEGFDERILRMMEEMGFQVMSHDEVRELLNMSDEDVAEARNSVALRAAKDVVDRVMAVEKLLGIPIEPGSFAISEVIQYYGFSTLTSPEFCKTIHELLPYLRDAYVAAHEEEPS